MVWLLQPVAHRWKADLDCAKVALTGPRHGADFARSFDLQNLRNRMFAFSGAGSAPRASKEPKKEKATSSVTVLSN
jgi:hypothetical protein